MPPPYRAPPPGLIPSNSSQHPPPPPKGASLPYSRFNVSEPNIGQYKSSPVGYRHTINHESSSTVQTNLKQMLSMPKHQTLDMNGQNAAIQHLRMQGLNTDQRQPQFSRNPHPEPGAQQQQTNDNYIGPDNLRNAANKMFARNGNERSSGYNGNIPPPVSYPNHQPPTSQNNFHYQQNLNHSQHSLNQSLNQSMEMQLSSEQQRQSQMQQNHPSRPRQNSAEDPAKRNSYGNQSFRNAIQTPGVNPHPPKPGQQQRLPPQVPPKPGSRSASKERPKDPNAEENDHLETELNNILRGNARDSFDKTNGSGTPPLPALSPSQSASQTPQSSPDFRVKYKLNQSTSNLNRPDLLENENMKKTGEVRSGGSGSNSQGGRGDSKGVSAAIRRAASINTENQNIKERMKELKGTTLNPGLDDHPEDLASTTTGLDLESVMALQTDLTSDEELSTTIDLSDAQAIRKQLDGLENMYTEVLKLLGLRKFGRQPANADMKSGIARRKMYGSMSSLPSVSSIGSRHLYGKDKRKDERKNRGTGKDKNYNKRFQRLESHVVTLARSVAHLSSEMRTQHVIVQEIEALRAEVQQLKLNRGHHTGSLPRGGVLEPQEFFGNHPRVSQQTENRVKKLTKFFGDEPPLLRLYLKNLGYEKYAGIFEEAKIGMLELPYLSEERLEKLGIPLGPRIRILQEAKIPYNLDGQNYNVYIL